MTTRTLWAAAALTALSTTGCLSGNQWQASLACGSNPASADCRYYSERVQEEKEGDDYSAWMKEERRREAGCASSGGRWQAGSFSAEDWGRYGSCVPLTPRISIPGMSMTFAWLLAEAARASPWPKETLDTQVRGAFCEVGNEADMRRALAIVGRSMNLGDAPPYVAVHQSSDSQSTYDVVAHPEEGWVLSLRDSDGLGPEDLIFERVVPEAGYRNLRLILVGGEERAYTACARGRYEPYLPR